MKHCPKCQIDFNTNRYTCPFCRNNLLDDDRPSPIIFQEYPVFEPRQIKRNTLVKIFSFITVMTFLILFVINYYELRNGSTDLWFFIPLAALAWLWVFIKGLILSKRPLSVRVWLLFFASLFLTCAIEYRNFLGVSVGLGWNINYLIPFFLIAGNVTLIFACFINSRQTGNYLMYVLRFSILSLIPFSCALFDLLPITWPSVACGLTGIASIIGMFMFGSRNTKEELKKRFHA